MALHFTHCMRVVPTLATTSELCISALCVLELPASRPHKTRSNSCGWHFLGQDVPQEMVVRPFWFQDQHMHHSCRSEQPIRLFLQVAARPMAQESWRGCVKRARIGASHYPTLSNSQRNLHTSVPMEQLARNVSQTVVAFAAAPCFDPVDMETAPVPKPRFYETQVMDIPEKGSSRDNN